MAHLGYADSIQLISFMIQGIFSLALNIFNHWVAKVVCDDLFGIYRDSTILQICISFANSGVYCSSSFTIALALNRLIQIVFTVHVDRYFSKMMTTVCVCTCSLYIHILGDHQRLLVEWITGVNCNAYTECYPSYISTLLDMSSFFQINRYYNHRYSDVIRSQSVCSIVTYLRDYHRFARETSKTDLLSLR